MSSEKEEKPTAVPSKEVTEARKDAKSMMPKLAMMIAAKLKRWKVAGTIRVGFKLFKTAMAISFEFDGIELARRTEEKERELKGIQDDEWSAESSIDRGEGGKIILRSENVHAVEPTNDPHNKAQSIFSWKRKLDNFVDGVLDSLTEIAIKMEEEFGLSLTLSVDQDLGAPKFFTLGEDCGFSVGLEIPLTKILAARSRINGIVEGRACGHLAIKALSGHGLPPMDDGSAFKKASSDPYLIFSLEGGKREDMRVTEVIKGSLEPVWNQELEHIPCAPNYETLYVSLYDWDTVGSDDLIDEWVIPVDKLELPANGSPVTVHAPLRPNIKGNDGKLYNGGYVVFEARYIGQ